MKDEKAASPTGAKPRFARRRGRLIAGAVVATALTLSVSVSSASGSTPQIDSAGSSGVNAALTHGRVYVDGQPIHYVRSGSGPAVVLLHGWPETWWEWRNLIPALATDHTVIAIDLPGLGDSGAPATGYDKATMARRVHQVVNQLGFTQVSVLGHDVGALIAYPYARDYPNEVRRVGVIETPLAGFGLEDLYGISWHFKFNSSPAPIPETIMDNDDVPTYLGMMFSFSVNGAGIDKNTYYRAYSDPNDRHAGYEYYRAFAADAVNNQAQAGHVLAQPVLAIGGAQSFGPGVAASFQQVASDVRTVIVPNSGHYVPEENPQYLAECTRLFFGPAGVPAPRADLATCVA